MNKEDARNWLRTFGDIPDGLRETCQRGHKECSTTRGGACHDDVIHAAVINVDAQPTQPSHKTEAST